MMSDNDLSKKLSEISRCETADVRSRNRIERCPYGHALHSQQGEHLVDVADVPVFRHAFRDLDVHCPTPVALTAVSSNAKNSRVTMLSVFRFAGCAAASLHEILPVCV
jgi:hypothetical protein